jgi:hypothetical protein
MKKLFFIVCLSFMNLMNAQSDNAETLKARNVKLNKDGTWNYVDTNGQISKTLVENDFVIVKDEETGISSVTAKKAYYVSDTNHIEQKLFVTVVLPKDGFNESRAKQANTFIDESYELFNSDIAANKKHIKSVTVIEDPYDQPNWLLKIETIYYNKKKQKKIKEYHYTFNITSEHTELLVL